MRVAIDASRNRSGGAITHLLGCLTASDPRESGIESIHVWAYRDLLDKLPDYTWLVKHSPASLEKTLIRQLLWQFFQFRHEINSAECDILLCTDAGTVGSYSPNIVMSRDMLSFEQGEMARYPLFSFLRLRLWLLKWVQIRSLRNADGVLFLTDYASSKIRQETGNLNVFRTIPHGVSARFRRHQLSEHFPIAGQTINCTYVSNSDLYKHQWNVIAAISELRKAGFKIRLNLVGATSGSAAQKTEKSARECDPHKNFVNLIPPQSQNKVVEYLFNSDIFIFASSCENMPNTLVEAMSAGLPIACSNRGPMPEVLRQGGVYFDPEDTNSIAHAVKVIIEDEDLRKKISNLALMYSNDYSWKRCAKETWGYLKDIHQKNSKSRKIG